MEKRYKVCFVEGGNAWRSVEGGEDLAWADAITLAAECERHGDAVGICADEDATDYRAQES